MKKAITLASKALTFARYFLMPVPFPGALIVHMIYGVWIAGLIQYPNKLEADFTLTCIGITVAICTALVLLINMRRGKA